MTRYHKLSIHKEMFGEDFDNVFNEFGGKILGFGNMWATLDFWRRAVSSHYSKACRRDVDSLLNLNHLPECQIFACYLLCRLLSSRAGSPWTTPLRASMPPLTEKLRHTMNALIAAFS